MKRRRPLPGWLAAALRTLGILLVLGGVLVHGTTGEVAEVVEVVEIVEIVEDLEPAVTVQPTAPPAERSVQAIASRSLARRIGVLATRPDVPPPRA